MKLINLSLGAFLAFVLFTACSPESDENPILTADFFNVENVENNHEFVQEVLEVVNEYRSSIGLSPLAEHETSEMLALSHSAYMVEQRKASHDNFFQRLDYLRSQGADIVSENVAFGFQSAESALQGWIDSPSHKAALEGDFTHTGIAVVATENGIKYYTQLFVKQ